MNRKNYVDVDTFQRDKSLDDAAALCGVELDVTGSGRNVRIDCPFGCVGDHAGKREIAVDTGNPAKQWKCHAYGCRMRGNLLTLMYGWLNGERPSTEKLRGAEFNEVKQVIAGDGPDTPPPQKPAGTPKEQRSAEPVEPKRNIPLVEAAKPETRGLVEPPLWEKLVREVGWMSPQASAYVRRHPCLSAEAMEKWHVGVMPADGGGDKRGWSLRNHVVYTFQSEENQVIGFVGRDPKYDEKLREFEATPPDERDANRRPMKHKFPKGFCRGVELFGQERGRLEEPGFREAIAKYGVIVVEGFNDVIRLDTLGIPALAICSNQITDEQVTKFVHYANELGGGRVSLFFDADDEGSEGAKAASWKLLQAGLAVRPAWGPAMYGDKFQGEQPESVSEEDLQAVILPGIARA